MDAEGGVSRLPEALAAQVNPLLKTNGRGLDELAVALFTRYTEQPRQTIARRQGAARGREGRG